MWPAIFLPPIAKLTRCSINNKAPTPAVTDAPTPTPLPDNGSAIASRTPSQLFEQTRAAQLGSPGTCER
jgi:hypothetical protein